jgi:hypothetical protein
MLWIAPVVIVIAAGSACGCGGSDDSGPVQRSEEAIKSDNKGQDAMKEFMQSKKGGSKKG